MQDPLLLRVVKLVVAVAIRTLDIVRARSTGRTMGVTLLYHDIPAGQIRNWRRQLEHLASRYTVVSLADLRRSPHADTIAITFDDALASFVDIAMPEFVARHWHSTLFVPAGLIGDYRAEFPYADGGPPLATWHELGALPHDLVEFGSHGMSHLDERGLDDDALARELADSKSAISDRLERPVRFHAYPYGLFDERVERAATQAGFEASLTVEPHRIDAQRGTGRVVVEPDDWPIEFRLKSAGAYRFMGWYMARKRLGQ